jgi:hypothetical protein
MGHALLTIDALVHTNAGSIYKSYGVPAIDPAWWVADIGIAAVWSERNGPDAPKVLPPLSSGEPDVPGYFAMSAPDPDLFGDIDGYCLLELWKGLGGSFSDLLTAYYLGSADEEAFYHKRFRIFTSAHLGDPDPTGPNLFPGVPRSFWLKRIERFCDLYAAGPLGAFMAVNPPRGKWKFADQVYNRFLSWVYTGFKKELELHP